jgi:hypothetical protein
LESFALVTKVNWIKQLFQVILVFYMLYLLQHAWAALFAMYQAFFYVWLIYVCLGCLQEYMLKAKFGLPSIEAEETVVEKRPPIRVKFEIPYFTVSGIQVKF